IARTLVSVCILLSVGFTCLAMAVTGILHTFLDLSPWVGSEVFQALYIFWPACFALSLYSLAQVTVLRMGLLRWLAVSRVLRAVALVLLQVCLVLAVSESALLLIIGELLANIGIAFLILWMA